MCLMLLLHLSILGILFWLLALTDKDQANVKVLSPFPAFPVPGHKYALVLSGISL